MKKFTVRHAGIRIKVKLLPTIKAVNREYRKGRHCKVNGVVHSFYEPNQSGSKGTMVLALSGNLVELVPHEVVHAVMWKIGKWVFCEDDERLATAVGELTKKILCKIARHYDNIL